MASALGGSGEHQKLSTPHYHANLHVVSMYQYKTLRDVAQAMQDKSLNLQNLFDYHSHICHEFYEDLNQHNMEVSMCEQDWPSYQSENHNLLTGIPTTLRKDASPSVWSTNHHELNIKEAATEAKDFAMKYRADVDRVLTRVNHHIHPLKEDGERVILSACKSKRKPTECKYAFPKDNCISEICRVICHSNAKKYGLRVSGRRNALGSVLGKRNEGWLSGTTPAFAAWFRSNTNTTPNYRVPLSQETHDTDCQSEK